MKKKLDFFREELKNFEEIARFIKPSSGEIPLLSGIEIYGETIPLNGVVGGDHIVYVDFNRRFDLDKRIQDAQKAGNTQIVEKLSQNRVRAGILIADVSGHRITDALMAAMLHQAFLLGVRYELSMFGEVTTELFENINTRFVNSSSISKYITMIYGEICESGMFHFVTAGHPDPVVFSNKYNKLSSICSDRVVHYPPIGTMPVQEDIDLKHTPGRLGYKKKYTVNEINLMGKGDIILLYTDGLLDHRDSRDRSYFSTRLESVIQKVKDDSAAEIFGRVKKDFFGFAPCEDDVSMVVIKKMR